MTEVGVPDGTSGSPGATASGEGTATDGTDVRDQLTASLPSRRAVGAGLWATAVGGVVIAMAQVDSLVQQVLVGDTTSSLTGLTSRGLLGGPGDTTDAWRMLAGRFSGEDPVLRLPGWISWYAGVDLAFIALYGAVVLYALWQLRPASGPGRAWLTGALALAALGVVADAVESFALIALAHGVDVLGVLFWLSAAKWAGLALAGVAAVIGRRQAVSPQAEPTASPAPEELPEPHGPVGRVVRALYTHRFSLLVVVPFGALGLASGSDILDQFPDVQRQWVDDRPALRVTVATVLNVVVAAVVWFVGRQRSHHVHRRVPPSTAPYRAPALWPWAFTAAVIGIGGAVSRWAFGLDVIGLRFWIALAVPAAVWVVSVVLRWVDDHRGQESPWSGPRSPVTRRQAETTLAVGDVLALLVLALPALGLVRAFVAPVALGNAGWNLAFLLFGAVAALGTWLLPALADRVLTARMPEGLVTALVPGREMSEGSASVGRVVCVGLLLGGVGLFLLIGFVPGWLVEYAGVTGFALLATTAVALPLGITVVLLQAGGAPDALSRRGGLVLRTAPVMTIIVITAVLVGLFGGDARVHGLRTTGEVAMPVRDTLSERVAALARESGCAVPLPGQSVSVRPVFVFAAEGGGIRAAAWTALGTDALLEAGGPCAAALMSSGASGGAVGLTVSAFGTQGAAFRDVTTMAGPDALTVAVAGLLVRDPVRSVTGIAFDTPGEAGWVDRAGLIELSWERGVQGLTEPYLSDTSGRVTGALVLNSTSVASQCRTLLSQVRLDERTDGSGCQTPSSRPDSVDLLAAMRSSCPSSTPSLRAGTVALLASRFPYVTPSGVVETLSCPSADGVEPKAQQIVDGGYADNDGLGTVVDLAPEWMTAVRAHNEGVVRARSGSLLVPVLVYFDNGMGSDVASSPGRSQNELLVPLKTKGGATASLSSTDTQLHRALEAFSTAQVVPGCAPGETTGLCTAVGDWRGSPVKVFYQKRTPSISAPLGWVLSSQSLDTLRCARDGQTAPALPALAENGCDAADAVAPEEFATESSSACPADRKTWDGRILLGRKGYGSMLSAICLAREARDAPPIATTPAPPG